MDLKSKDVVLENEIYEKIVEDCCNKTYGLSDDDWQDIVDRYNLSVNRDTLRKNFTGIFGSAFVKKYYDEKNACENSSNEYIKELNDKKRELEIERKKLQSEKVEYNKMLREDARSQLFVEKMQESIDKLVCLKHSPKHISEYGAHDREFCLFFGDAHYGADLCIKDLFGNVINEYSPEKFRERMQQLFTKVLGIIHHEGINTLNIVDLGDDIDGILRMSQLMKLRMGVVDAAMEYAEYMGEWLNELSHFVTIKYQSVNGNHDELRLLDGKRGNFPEDNMCKIISSYIKLRLKDNDNFIMIENPTGYGYMQLCGSTVLCMHGSEIKGSRKSVMDQLSSLYHPIDYLVSAHLHHAKNETVGLNKEIIQVPSIIGIDDYSISLNKSANPGATLVVFEKSYGKTVQYDIKLD